MKQASNSGIMKTPVADYFAWTTSPGANPPSLIHKRDKTTKHHPSLINKISYAWKVLSTKFSLKNKLIIEYTNQVRLRNKKIHQNVGWNKLIFKIHLNL